MFTPDPALKRRAIVKWPYGTIRPFRSKTDLHPPLGLGTLKHELRFRVSRGPLRQSPPIRFASAKFYFCLCAFSWLTAFSHDEYCHEPRCAGRPVRIRTQTGILPAYVFSVAGTSRCDVRAACSGATPSSVARIFVPPATTRVRTAQRAIPTIAQNTYLAGRPIGEKPCRQDAGSTFWFRTVANSCE